MIKITGKKDIKIIDYINRNFRNKPQWPCRLPGPCFHRDLYPVEQERWFTGM